MTRETLPPDLPITLVLEQPARSKFLIRGSDGPSLDLEDKVTHKLFHLGIVGEEDIF